MNAMFLKSSVGRRRVAALLLSAALAWMLSPNLFSSGDKTAPKLRPEPALVPPDAFAFVHLRAGEVWGNDAVAKLRQQFGKSFDPSIIFGFDLADVDSVSFVVPTAESIPM